MCYFFWLLAHILHLLWLVAAIKFKLLPLSLLLCRSVNQCTVSEYTIVILSCIILLIWMRNLKFPLPTHMLYKNNSVTCSILALDKVNHYVYLVCIVCRLLWTGWDQLLSLHIPFSTPEEENVCASLQETH